MRYIYFAAFFLLSLGLQAQSDSSKNRLIKPQLQRNSHNLGFGASLGIIVHSNQRINPGFIWEYSTNLSYAYFVLNCVSIGLQHMHAHAEHTVSGRMVSYNLASPFIRAHLPFSLISKRAGHIHYSAFTEVGYWRGKHHRNYSAESELYPNTMVPMTIGLDAIFVGLGVELPFMQKKWGDRWTFQIYHRRNFLGRGAEWRRDMSINGDTKLGLLYHFGKPHRPLVLGDK